MDPIITLFKPTVVIILITTVCVPLSITKCLDMPLSIYCTNLLGNGTNETLILESDSESLKKDVQMIYLQNCSGNINDDTFLNFPNIRTLDIQFSNIHNFSLKSISISVLHLMYNSKFPRLSANFMKMCCQNVSTLFIMDNNEPKIDTGAFKHMNNLTHITISKQNITKLTKNYFEGLEKLTYLNLKENGIFEIDENAFENLTILNNLILSSNNFTKFYLKTFENLKVLETLEMYDIDFSDFNLTIFNNQKELKALGLPRSLIKMEKVELTELTKTFPTLEYLGFLNVDTQNTDVSEYIKKCKASGYNIMYN